MKLLWKIYKYIAVSVFTLFLAEGAVLLFFSLYQPTIQQAEDAIILGAAIYTPALYNRSLEGLKLYEEGKVAGLVLSGGRISDKDISEAQYMKRVIEKNSSKEVSMILEENSRNTYENIRNSRKLIPGAESIVVVSDRFHIARAVLLAKRAGFETVYWSSPKPKYYKVSELAFYYIREMFAMVTYLPKFIWG